MKQIDTHIILCLVRLSFPQCNVAVQKYNKEVSMKFLDYYGLSGIRHKDIDFFNSDIYNDVAVFIDPFVIN